MVCGLVIANIAIVVGQASVGVDGYTPSSPLCNERTGLTISISPNHGLPGSSVVVTAYMDRSFATPIVFWDGQPMGGLGGGIGTMIIPDDATAGPHEVSIWTVDTFYAEFCEWTASTTFTVDTVPTPTPIDGRDDTSMPSLDGGSIVPIANSTQPSGNTATDSTVADSSQLPVAMPVTGLWMVPIAISGTGLAGAGVWLLRRR